jgi:hypothetical protein
MWLGIKDVEVFGITDPSLKNKVLHLNDENLEREQYENLAWYSGNGDVIRYFYQRLMNERHYLSADIRPNFRDYYWYTNNEEGVKKTHSGLPRMIIDTIDNCVSYPTLIKPSGMENEAKAERAIEILDLNNFKSILSHQIKLMAVLGDGAFFVNIVPRFDFPIIEYVPGTECDFVFEGSVCTAITRKRYYRKNGHVYQLLEERSTEKIEDEDGEKTCAVIKYNLFCLTGDNLKEVDLSALDETKNLKSLRFNNISFMLATPCIYNFDSQTERGTSIFRGKIDLFDDFDQAVSQEASIMRAMTPVEYIDVASLEVDANTGQKMKPGVYGKQYIYYKTAESLAGIPEAPHSSFYDIDFSKIDTYAIEVMQRALSGILSMATIGLDVARNSTDLAQREKEKITSKTVARFAGIEGKIIAKLLNIVLACDELRQDADALYSKTDFTVDFPEYANASFESRIESLLPLYQSGGISEEMFVSELWGDSLSNEDKEKEVARLKEAKASSSAVDFSSLGL